MNLYIFLVTHFFIHREKHSVKKKKSLYRNFYFVSIITHLKIDDSDNLEENDELSFQSKLRPCRIAPPFEGGLRGMTKRLI